MKITIPGQPITKKNSQIRVQGRSLILPSKAFQQYERFCIGTKRNPGWLIQWRNICFDVPVQLTCHYWMKNRRQPDLLNLLAATSDILEKAGIIQNDVLVHSVDGSKIIGVDKENPRVEIEIKEI